jgi:hypothetical protein
LGIHINCAVFFDPKRKKDIMVNICIYLDQAINRFGYVYD